MQPSAKSYLPLKPVIHATLFLDSDNSISIFPLTGPNQKQVGSIAKGIDLPWGLSVDSANSLYVANSGNGTVTVYPYGSSTPSITYSGRWARPLYAVADSAGHVFVSGFTPSLTRGRVVEYAAGTNVVIAKTLLGVEADGIAVDQRGNLYVAYRSSYSQASVAEFGPGLTHRRLLGMAIDQPQGLLVDRSGNVVVAESESQDIKVFPPGRTTPSVTVTIRGSYDYGNLAELAMRKAEKTLWVCDEMGDVHSMPYPLTSSTVPTEYEATSYFSNGLALSSRPFK
jgi:hypothetical protein